jgi:hypothetical protein
MQVPPLGGPERAKLWTECIAVPTNSSQSLPGRSQSLLQDQQRPFKPMQRPAERHGEIQYPDRVHIGFEPDVLRLDVNINDPDEPKMIRSKTLEAQLDPGDLSAYAQVLRGVFDGDPTLSVRGDTAVRCWRIVEPVLNVWRADKVPLLEYRPVVLDLLDLTNGRCPSLERDTILRACF